MIKFFALEGCVRKVAMMMEVVAVIVAMSVALCSETAPSRCPSACHLFPSRAPTPPTNLAQNTQPKT